MAFIAASKNNPNQEENSAQGNHHLLNPSDSNKINAQKHTASTINTHKNGAKHASHEIVIRPKYFNVRRQITNVVAAPSAIFID